MSETATQTSEQASGYMQRWQLYQWADHHEHSGYPSSVGVVDSEGDSLHDICQIDCTEMSKEDAWAAANLIESAPELASALRELHDFAVADTHHRHAERSQLAFSRAAAILKKLGM